MLVFHKKKAVRNFHKKHNTFLYWYLVTRTNIPERHYHLFNQYIVKQLMQDIDKLIHYDERKQREWIMQRVDNFAYTKDGGECDGK